jgi:hypothetical protein
MTAVQSLSIGLGTGIPVPAPVSDFFGCALEEALDNRTNWTSPFRPTYQCVGDPGSRACVRRGTYGGVPGGGFGMSAVTSLLAPRNFPIYPSCGACLDACVPS